MKRSQETKQSKVMKHLQAMKQLATIAGDEMITTTTSDETITG
jgi:hypothetical protein